MKNNQHELRLKNFGKIWHFSARYQ